MGFRFRRTIRIAPGVRLNLSKSGASASVGRRGASVTVGRRGVYQNVGLPGTGLSYRRRLDAPGARPPSAAAGTGGRLLLWVLAIGVGVLMLSAGAVPFLIYLAVVAAAWAASRAGRARGPRHEPHRLDPEPPATPLPKATADDAEELLRQLAALRERGELSAEHYAQLERRLRR